MQYVKIKDTIIEQIEAGMLAAREKLPAERKLAEMFDTTRITLREALSLLEAEGRIYREDRRGWFISPEPLQYNPTQVLSFHRMAKQQHRIPNTELISAKSTIADKQATRLLQLAPFSDVFKVERVHYLDARPVVHVMSYLRSDCFPNLLDHDLSVSLTEIYQQYYDMQFAKSTYRISTTTLLAESAQRLRATSGVPAMLLERVNYNQHGELVNGSIEYWRHDAISIAQAVDLSGGIDA